LYLVSHFIILLTAYLVVRYPIRSDPQFISPISLVTSCQNLTTYKFANSDSRLSSALMTVVTWQWNRSPHSFCSAMKFGLISVNMFTQRVAGTLR